MKSDPNTTVLIIGCGWLGKKLGAELKEHGYQVTGTTRSRSNFPDLKQAGITPALLDVSPNPEEDLSIPAADWVFISVSPGRGDAREQYPEILSRIAGPLKINRSNVVLFSSTSVYKGLKGIVSEPDALPDPDNSDPILEAEGLLMQALPDAVILRFGGLCGPDRHPVTYLSGRTGIADGDAPVNLIHSDDCVQVCISVINKSVTGEIFNVCAPKHPSRHEVYVRSANKRGLQSPQFEEGGKDGKKVSPDKLIRVMNYTFLQPDPLNY